MIWPITNIGSGGIYISQKFGENPQVYAQFGLKGHNGIDIAAPSGTPIYAAHGGSLKFLQENGGYGQYAEITAPDNKTVYAHMSKFEGGNRKVKQGDLIGYVGSTGFSTGPHLHFGIKLLRNGQVLNYNNGYFGSIDAKPYLEGNTMARVIREPSGTLRIEFGSGDKKVNLGINEPTFASQIAQSGEPIIDVPAATTSKQIGVIEAGLVIDSE